MKYYLGQFPTPGGDKWHLFALEDDRGIVTNSIGPVELENLVVTSDGFSGDMPAGPGKHHFEARYIDGGLHVDGTVIMEGNPVGTYASDMKLADSDELPADEESPVGPGGPPPAKP